MNQTENLLANKIIFFDMDDTLIDTQRFYNETNRKCAEMVIQFAPYPVSIEEVMLKKSEIDRVNVKKMGFVPERFPNTWQETLFFFVPEATSEQQIQMYAQSREVFTATVPLIEDVVETLHAIKSKAQAIHLFTAGDIAIQEKRIFDSGIGSLFDQIHIVPMKTPQVMKQVIQTPDDSVMVGNSLKSDIMPALTNGVFAIHIERETWDYDQHTIDETDPNYLRLKRFSDLLSI